VLGTRLSEGTISFRFLETNMIILLMFSELVLLFLDLLIDKWSLEDSSQQKYNKNGTHRRQKEMKTVNCIAPAVR
jgi:hypothetical protein